MNAVDANSHSMASIFNYICEARGQSYHELDDSPCRLLQAFQGDSAILTYEVLLKTLAYTSFLFLIIYYNIFFYKNQKRFFGGERGVRTLAPRGT